ncbi:MAG: hypothetical protein K8U57_27070 [Planctomycetes bacterium]|nr:hypothetical protein [Planctomycetota bacterium]
MRRLSVFVVILLAAVVIGCGPGKELPDAVIRPKDVSGPKGDQNTTPTTSDPEAKAVVERAIKAITENDPTRLSKAKTAKVAYQGENQRQGPGSAMVKMVCTIETVWPEFALVKYDYKEFVQTFTLRGPQGWNKYGLTLVQMAPVDVGRLMRNDLTACHWMLLGLPLADPKAIVFSPTKTAMGTSVKISLSDLPIYQVTFDKGSGLPVRNEYAPLENGVRTPKFFTMSDHKSTGGFLLPTKIELTQGDAVVERFTEPIWEFPESIDPSRFEQPK